MSNLKTASAIMKIMNTIEYGLLDDKNIERLSLPDGNKYFDEHYFLQTPDELLKSKCGVCWDQVELERKLFFDKNIDCQTYFIYIDINNNPTHTFLVFEDQNNYYWFEHSWEMYRGIHEYNNLKELLIDVKNKHLKFYNSLDAISYIYKYDKPEYHLSCADFWEYCTNQDLVDLNDI